MLIKKLYKSIILGSLLLTTTASAGKTFVVGYGYTSNPDSYSTISKNLQHEDVYKYWHTPPDILVCENSQVKKEDVLIAKSMWERTGIKIGDVKTEKETKIKCPDNAKDFIDGYIFIIKDMSGITGEYWGLTKRTYNYCDNIFQHPGNHCVKGKGRHGYVVSARIQVSNYIQRNNNLPALLAHEIGHGLGFKHVDNPKDIMTENSIGWRY